MPGKVALLMPRLQLGHSSGSMDDKQAACLAVYLTLLEQ